MEREKLRQRRQRTRAAADILLRNRISKRPFLNLVRWVGRLCFFMPGGYADADADADADTSGV